MEQHAEAGDGLVTYFKEQPVKMSKTPPDNDSLNFGRIKRILLNNIGVAVSFVILAFVMSMVGDFMFKPTPSLIDGLTAFFVDHGGRIASLGFIAVTLPMVSQYSSAKWER